MEIEKAITERWQEFIDAGVLEADHIDDDGEIIYVINEDNLDEYDPLFFQEYKNAYDAQIAHLISEGLMEVYIEEDGEVTYAPTEKCQEWLEAYSEEVVD